MKGKKHLLALTSILLLGAVVVAPLSGAIDATTLSPTALAIPAGWGISDVGATSATNTTATTTEPEPEPYTSERFKFSAVEKAIKQYQGVNQDTIGWLYVPGTNINEPIVHSSVDNDYYLYRDINGKNYPNTNYLNYVNTAIYTDFRTKFGATWKKSSKNMILYGHNWNNLRDPMKIGDHPGLTMFAQLPSYTDAEFAATNPYIYFSTGDNEIHGTSTNEGIWKVFAVGYTEISPDFFYNNPRPTTAQLDEIITEWKARSILDFGVEVDNTDRLLTLSTCTRANVVNGNTTFDGQRYVVVARLLREGETENDAVTVRVKDASEIKQPKF